MTTPQRRQAILDEMSSLTRMERGKLCAQSRGRGSQTFHKLQCWHQGKNHTRYVPAHEVPLVQAALAGHARFQQLAGEFVDLTIAQTHKENQAEGKKNSRKSRASDTGKAKPS